MLKSQRLTIKIFFSMLISLQLVTAKMLTSLQKQRNVDFTRTRKFKDVDFTLIIAKY